MIYNVRQVGLPGTDAQIDASQESLAAERYAKTKLYTFGPCPEPSAEVFVEVAVTRGASTVYAYWRVQPDTTRPGEFLLRATNYATAVSLSSRQRQH